MWLIVIKMAKPIKPKVLELPEGVDVSIDGSIVTIKGPKGELTRDFKHPSIRFEIADDKLVVKTVNKKPTKRDKMFINTFAAHLRNMIVGVTKGYVAKLKICSGHFPMNVSISNGKLIIKNFFGEKIPREAKLYNDVNVNIDGEFVIVKGINKESVGQTAANIEQSTRIKNRDRRVFQDGIWIVEKTHPEE